MFIMRGGSMPCPCFGSVGLWSLACWLLVGFGWLLALCCQRHTPNARPRSARLSQSDRDCPHMAPRLQLFVSRFFGALVRVVLVGCLGFGVGSCWFFVFAPLTRVGNLLSRLTVNDFPSLPFQPGSLFLSSFFGIACAASQRMAVLLCPHRCQRPFEDGSP